MICTFKCENVAILYRTADLLNGIARELRVEFKFVLIQEYRGDYALEVGDVFWGNSLEPLVRFLEAVERIELKDACSAKIVPNLEVPFLELRKKYIRAAGSHWIRMGMYRVVDKEKSESFFATDLMGSSYLFLLSALVRQVKLFCIVETKIKEKNNNRAPLRVEFDMKKEITQFSSMKGELSQEV